MGVEAQNGERKLWVKVVEAVHKTKYNWNFNPFRASMGGVWCNIAKTFSKTLIDGIPLRSFFRSKVGNGENTAFWLDPWLCGEPFKSKYPELFRLEKEKGCRVVDRIKPRVNSGGFTSNYGWVWKRHLSNQVEVNELIDLCSRLLNVTLVDTSDRWEWNGAEDRVYSVGAVKKILNFDQQNVNSQELVE
ncbi:hypothetical protein Hdeb2414_s0014g00425151 [Helianthus debilis subsp. tardiflorus]